MLMTVLRWLAEEDRDPFMDELIDRGPEFHHEWVAQTFAPQLEVPPRSST
jgi:hypothetical protein